MLVMEDFFIAFRWIHLSTPLIRLFLLVLILLLMPTLHFLPVWFALSLLRFRLPSRLPMMLILWLVDVAERVVNSAGRQKDHGLAAKVQRVRGREQRARLGEELVAVDAGSILRLLIDEVDLARAHHLEGGVLFRDRAVVDHDIVA